ncbi:MAG: hypothetical protein ABFD82_20330 [Syntrophaceae bacterium]
MKTAMVALAFTLLAGCAIVPAGPYDVYGGPYYSTPYYPSPGYYYYPSPGYYYYGPGFHRPWHRGYYGRGLYGPRHGGYGHR